MRSSVLIGFLALTTSCGKTSEEGFERLAKLDGVFGVPNIDDDDDNGTPDWEDMGAPEDNDLALLSLDGLTEGLHEDSTVIITLSGDGLVRVWQGDRILFEGDGSTQSFDVASVPDLLQVEFGDYLTSAVLTVGLRDKKDEFVREVVLPLRSAPLILNHHLQPAERAYVVRDLGYNDAMMADLEAVLGDRIASRDVVNFDFDVWVQDEFETATLNGPDSRIDVVIDSIRDGLFAGFGERDGYGLDDYPEKVLGSQDDTLVNTWGAGIPTSQDSFGNLEIAPPVTVDGVEWPFGRIYYGVWGDGDTMVKKLANFLDDQRVQAPFQLDVSWLCVGHVDEYTTFLPDPSAPKGFRLYVADVDEGYALLEEFDPSTELGKYRSGHGYGTIGEILEHAPLRDLNHDYQSDYIEPAIDIFREELGLTDEDIVRIPALFEEAMGCGPYGVSLIPGTANMLVTTNDDGSATLFIPDPFLRPGGASQDQDPLIAAVNAVLPSSATPVWVDDWNSYHLMWGEVHCGTNTTRTPTAQWWTDALHLIDEEN